jgi:hypothetical protein
MKKLILLIITVLFSFQDSCKKEPICYCGIEQPEENLSWLKNHLAYRFCTEVYSLFFNGIEYIIISDCPGPDAMSVFFDCQGNKTCEYGGANAGGGSCNMPVGFTFEFYEENKKLIYKQP